jgi:hypothetical protein
VARSIVAFIDNPCLRAFFAWMKGYSGRCSGFQWIMKKRRTGVAAPGAVPPEPDLLLPNRPRPRETEGMAKARHFLLFFIAMTSAAAGQPQALGIFGSWGAFRGEGRCYAITQPFEAPAAEGWQAFASVGHWPARGGGQLHVRLSREKRQGSAVLLRIDGRSFQLIGGGRDAWAAEARADQEIQAAMRTGIDMIVETRSTQGLIVRDHYRLRGAATAMDAAAIACARRR